MSPSPSQSDVLVERVARAIDGEAWEAIHDGRDVPGTFWNIRRDVARAKAKYALETSHHAELVEALRQFVNGVETHMIDSPAEETLANITRRANAVLAKARGTSA